jgi:hypothetical protein
MKDGSFVNTKALIKGPHYYLLVNRSRDKKADNTPFLNLSGLQTIIIRRRNCILIPL